MITLCGMAKTFTCIEKKEERVTDIHISKEDLKIIESNTFCENGLTELWDAKITIKDIKTPRIFGAHGSEQDYIHMDASELE